MARRNLAISTPIARPSGESRPRDLLPRLLCVPAGHAQTHMHRARIARTDGTFWRAESSMTIEHA